VISLDLALRLHDAGVAWTPGNGDRFWLPDRELDETVFTVSDMVVEVREHAGGRVLAFNGTTEWALDAIEEHEVVLDLLGARFVSLTARSGGHVVRVRTGQSEQEHVDVGAADAAARAVLGLLEQGDQAGG
jgi:hypothetical protein